MAKEAEEIALYLEVSRPSGQAALAQMALV